MRRVYSGRFPSIPVYQRISPFLPIESTINALGAYSIYLHRIPPATDSEPVSLGSNPSSPVLISHAPRGFRHSGAGLPRERGGGAGQRGFPGEVPFFWFFDQPGGQRDSLLLTCTELEDCSHFGAISASGAASRGARKTTSAPPSSRASPRSPPAPRSGSATAACSRGNRCRSSSRKSR